MPAQLRLGGWEGQQLLYLLDEGRHGAAKTREGACTAASSAHCPDGGGSGVHAGHALQRLTEGRRMLLLNPSLLNSWRKRH